MQTYNVALTNPDDARGTAPSSYGSGKYLNVVKADSMEAAVDAAIRDARAGGYYGHDWSACITPLDRFGQRQGRALSWAHERDIDLRDGGRR